MASEGDSVVDKLKDKVSSAREKAGGTTEESGADIDYEPAPEQEILADGMVVLGKDQVTSSDSDDDADEDADDDADEDAGDDADDGDSRTDS